MEIQAYTRKYLSDRLGVAARVTVPNPRPPRFLLVRREGGSMLDGHRDSAGIGVDMWAPTDLEAARLAMEVRDAMRELAYRPGVARVDEELLQNSPDPDDGSPRWYGSWTLVTYGCDELEV
ncbi:MAG: hypothetical protein ACI364_02820 [Coriobacteriales bacterium]